MSHSTIEQMIASGRVSIDGATPLMRSEDAISFVQECREQNVRVLRIDGYLITECGVRQHRQEHVIDIQDASTSDFTRETIDFLRERESLGLLFEVIVDEE